MRVKIGKFIFDSNVIPVMLVLADDDKKNIANMAEDANSYCSFPAGLDPERIKRWMEVEPMSPDPATVIKLMSDMGADSGIAAIIRERDNQISNGFDTEHDAEFHADYQLAEIASQLILQAADPDSGQDDEFGIIEKHSHDPKKLLEIAGALIAAELDRRIKMEMD